MSLDEIKTLHDRVAMRLVELRNQGLTHEQAFSVAHQEMILTCMLIRAMLGVVE